jgi:uncharacterized protein YjbI with pentapeptide repeats
MSPVNWLQVVVDILQAVISGIFVGVALYLLDERRALRERRLSDFRIASNWSETEPKVSLRYFDLTKRNLSGRKFIKADLESATITEAELWATNFSKANLRRANFRKSKIVGVKFFKAIANGADFSGTMIRKTSDPEHETVANFTGVELRRCKFIDARLDGVIMVKADLTSADFSKAIVLNCDFTGADLTDSKWSRVKRVENCIWRDVKINKPEDFPPTLWKEIQGQNTATKR